MLKQLTYSSKYEREMALAEAMDRLMSIRNAEARSILKDVRLELVGKTLRKNLSGSLLIQSYRKQKARKFFSKKGGPSYQFKVIRERLNEAMEIKSVGKYHDMDFDKLVDAL